MRDLLLTFEPGTRPRAALEDALRTAIRQGRMTAGTALPSTRALANDLDIARSTVVGAYEQLVVEGYLVAEQGRSTRVASVPVSSPSVDDRNPLGATPRFDFRPGEPTVGSFPRREWQRSMRRVLLEAPDDVFGYGDPRGRLEVRTALAQYLARSRGLDLDASAIRMYAGFASALGFVGEMLQHRGLARIAVEQPMLFFHRQILELVGLETIPIPVDDHGLVVAELRRHELRAVLVTPGNHQPLGVTMSPERRSQLVSWAREVDGWVIEDDYDGEFRFDRRPIGALQGLDAGRVLYAGTASKSMAPGLHLSWLVVPPQLRRNLAAVTHMRAGVSTINQLALADLIARGAYDRHVRERRREYRRRRTMAAECLADIEWLRTGSGQAGMHLVCDMTEDGIDEATVVASAERESIGLIGLQTHFDHPTPGLVINVSRPPDHQFAAALDRLHKFLVSRCLAPGQLEV